MADCSVITPSTLVGEGGDEGQSKIFILNITLTLTLSQGEGKRLVKIQPGEGKNTQLISAIEL